MGRGFYKTLAYFVLRKNHAAQQVVVKNGKFLTLY
jgi:hypothetical protein